MDKEKDLKNFKAKINAKGYTLQEKIAEGSFGNIFLALETKTKEVRVIKIVEIKTKQMKQQMKKEIQLLTQLSNNPKIVKLFEHFQYKSFFSRQKFFILVFEKMEMDLMDLILIPEKLPIKTIKKIFFEICLSVKELHVKGIAHLDIKPDNVLLKTTGEATVEVKLCDFGFSDYFNSENNKKEKRMRKFIGTKEYAPPEIYYNNDEYLPSSFQAEKSDIWSLGVTLFTLITKLFPFTYHDDRIADSTDQFFAFVGDDFGSDDEENCSDLFSLIFKINSWERPSIHEIIQHPWFSDLSSTPSSSSLSSSSSPTSSSLSSSCC